MASPAVRLLPAAPSGWWAIFGKRAAFLPSSAVTEIRGDAEDASHTVDVDRGRQLVDTAARRLTAIGFFREENVAFQATVLPAMACNLGCEYCFQNQPDSMQINAPRFAPRRRETPSMTTEVVDATVDFLRRRMSQAARGRLDLLLFGGEPLINLPGTLQLLTRAKTLGLRNATLVTNAVLLTPRTCDRLVEAGLTRIAVSLDGHRSAHDATRHTRSGRPTYDGVIGNVLGAAAQYPNLRWRVRVNVDRKSLEGLPLLLKDLAPLPTLSNEVYWELGLVDDVGVGYSIDLSYSAVLAQQLIRINTEAIHHGFKIAPHAPKTECPFCGDHGRTGCVVDADGALYSNWEAAGDPAWRVGHVETGYDADVPEPWATCGYGIRPHGDIHESRQFFDAIDQAALDAQRASGLATRV